MLGYYDVHEQISKSGWITIFVSVSDGDFYKLNTMPEKSKRSTTSYKNVRTLKIVEFKFRI